MIGCDGKIPDDERYKLEKAVKDAAYEKNKAIKDLEAKKHEVHESKNEFRQLK